MLEIVSAISQNSYARGNGIASGAVHTQVIALLDLINLLDSTAFVSQNDDGDDN